MTNRSDFGLPDFDTVQLRRLTINDVSENQRDVNFDTIPSPEDKDTMFLRNGGVNLRNYTLADYCLIKRPTPVHAAQQFLQLISLLQLPHAAELWAPSAFTPGKFIPKLLHRSLNCYSIVTCLLCTSRELRRRRTGPAQPKQTETDKSLGTVGGGESM